MKKIFNILVLMLSFIMVVGFVVAQGGEGARDATGPMHDEIVAAGGLGGEGLERESPDMPVAEDGVRQVRAGNFEIVDGRRVKFEAKAQNRLEFGTNGLRAETALEILQENATGKLRTKLSNGRNAEVKVMPETASERALARLRLKNCNETNNCTIELKEVGQGNQTRLAYELKTQRESKVFGLFRARMNVQAQVDAENGEVIRTRKPWWAFLATEPEEEEVVESTEVTESTEE